MTALAVCATAGAKASNKVIPENAKALDSMGHSVRATQFYTRVGLGPRLYFRIMPLADPLHVKMAAFSGGKSLVRKLTIGLLFIAFCCAAFGQAAPQWKIVKVVTLSHQTTAIPQTTLFTPANQGFYRVSAYISSAGSSQADWTLAFSWNDINGEYEQTGTTAADGPPSPALGFVFVPQPGTPVNYSVSPVGVEAGYYDVVFTIEQLQTGDSKR